MKRHIMNGPEVIKKESKSEENNVIKKRLKVSHKDGAKPDTSKKFPGNIMEDAHHEINGDSEFVQISKMVTSTPVAAQNGTTADKSENIVSEPSGANGTFAVITANNISNLVGDSHVPSPINGGCLFKDETAKTVSDDETRSLPPTGELNEKSSIEDDVDVVNVENVEETESSMKDCSFKYDIDSFLGSFLEVVELDGHAAEVLSVVCDNDIILSASADTTIKLWNPATKTEVLNFHGHTASVTALTLLTPEQTAAISSKLNFSDVSRIIISASLDCSVRMWALNSGVQLSSFYTFNGITCLEYLEDSHEVVIGTDGGNLEVWNLISSKVVHSIGAHEKGVTSLKTEDCHVYTTSTDGKVKVWLLEEDECYATYTRRRMQRTAGSSELKPAEWNCIACHDHVMYLGDNTSNLKILDSRKGSIKLLKNPNAENGNINSIIIKENILLSLFYDAVTESSGINVWKLPSMTYACTISGTVDELSCLAMTATDDKVLRIVTGGKKLLVWNFITAKPPSDENDAKYYCRELADLGNEVEESDESDKEDLGNKVEESDESDKPQSLPKVNVANKEVESKPAPRRCIVM